MTSRRVDLAALLTKTLVKLDLGAIESRATRDDLFTFLKNNTNTEGKVEDKVGLAGIIGCSAVDGRIFGNDLGTGMNARKMPVGNLLPSCRVSWCQGMFRRCFLLYSILFPKHARAVSFLIISVFGDCMLNDDQLTKIFKAINSEIKRVSGEVFDLGDDSFQLDALSNFCDLARFVGFNAVMPPHAEAVEWAYNWLIKPVVLSDVFMSNKGGFVFAESVIYALNQGGEGWRPKAVAGLTSLEDSVLLLPDLFTQGAAPPGLPRLFYLDRLGRRVDLAKNKLDVLGAMSETDFIQLLKDTIQKPETTIRVLVKPNELGKLRHISIDGLGSYLIMAVWLHEVMQVLRGHMASPLFHGIASEVKRRELFIRLWTETSGVALPLDESKFDEHKSKFQVLTAVDAVGKWAVQHMENTSIFHVLTATVSKLIEGSDIEVDGEVIGKYGNGIASGWAITAFIDTIINLAQVHILSRGMTTVQVAGQGDDVDLLVNNLQDAQELVKRYTSAGFDVNAEKQSYGTFIPHRPLSEFLRKVTSIGGDILEMTAPEAKNVSLRKYSRVVNTVEELSQIPFDALVNCFVVIGRKPKEWREDDFNIWLFPEADELQPEGEGFWDFQEEVKVQHSDDGSFHYSEGRLRASRWQWDAVPLVATVYGYGARMIPTRLIREKGTESESAELAIQSSVSAWFKLASRGADYSAVVSLLLRELVNMTKTSEELICDWLSTPSQIGGAGVLPLNSRRFVSVVLSKDRSRYFPRGYNGVLDAKASSLGFEARLAAQVVYKRVTGLPEEKGKLEWSVYTNDRMHYWLSLLLGEGEPSTMRFPLKLRVQGDSPLQLELIGEKLLSFEEDGDTLQDFISTVTDDVGRAQNARMRRRASKTVYLDWIRDRLGPFKAPRFWCYADSWVSEIYLGFAERTLHSLLNRQRLSMSGVESAAMWAALLTEREIQTRTIVFRD